MKDKEINIDELLEVTIKSQMIGKEEIPVKFPNKTKVLITGTGDKSLESYVKTEAVSLGIQLNYSETVQKTKVLLNDGRTAYFKNDYLKEA